MRRKKKVNACSQYLWSSYWAARRTWVLYRVGVGFLGDTEALWRWEGAQTSLRLNLKLSSFKKKRNYAIILPLEWPHVTCSLTQSRDVWNPACCDSTERNKKEFHKKNTDNGFVLKKFWLFSFNFRKWTRKKVKKKKKKRLPGHQVTGALCHSTIAALDQYYWKHCPRGLFILSCRSLHLFSIGSLLRNVYLVELLVVFYVATTSKNLWQANMTMPVPHFLLNSFANIWDFQIPIYRQ